MYNLNIYPVVFGCENSEQVQGRRDENIIGLAERAGGQREATSLIVKDEIIIIIK